MKLLLSIMCALCVLVNAPLSYAAEEPVDDELVLDDEDDELVDDDNYVLPDVLVSYKPADIARIGGSANLIEEKDLEAAF